MVSFTFKNSMDLPVCIVARGESERREKCHRCYLSLDPSSKIVATIIFIIISIHLEPFRIIIPDPSLRLVWLLEPSSKFVLFRFFSKLLKKHTLNPEITLLYQFHAQKALFQVPKIGNINFSIENDPTSFGTFPKNSSDLVAGPFPYYHYLFVFLSFQRCVFLSFCLFMFLPFCLFVFSSFCLFIFLSFRISVFSHFFF